MPWQSKGLRSIGDTKQQQWQATIRQISENGIWPVVTDASPCAKNSQLVDGIEVLDSIDFANKYLLERLRITPIDEPVWLHVTCSSQHLDGGKAMLQLAKTLGSEVHTTAVSCCGFGGDKGFTHPQLNQHALRHVRAIKPNSCERGYANSHTCEIGLQQHSGVPFTSLLLLLDECSKAVGSEG